MIDRDTIGSWLTRGAAATRNDARRALRELVQRGDLSEDEARAIEEAVSEAVSKSLDGFARNVITPLQGVLRSVVGQTGTGSSDPELLGRLDEIAQRLERVESRLIDLERQERDGE